MLVTTDLRVYANEHGDPVVVMVTTGTHDVSRLVALMERGRCEDVGRAHQLLAACRRANAGRTALNLLAEHGGPDLLTPAPGWQDRARALHQAVADPGKVVRRERERDGGWETVTHWQTRAVLAVTAPWMAEQDQAA
jgi:hypothetical protein